MMVTQTSLYSKTIITGPTTETGRAGDAGAARKESLEKYSSCQNQICRVVLVFMVDTQRNRVSLRSLETLSLREGG